MADGLVHRAQTRPTAPVAEPAEDDESNATPEEQEAYDAAMKMVGELLYTDDESYQAIMNLISEDDLAGTIAEATIFALSQIEETFQGQYPEVLIVPTVDEISDMLMELVDESGKAKITEQVAADVKVQVIEQLADEYGADPADLQEALGDVTQADVDEMQSLFGGRNG